MIYRKINNTIRIPVIKTTHAPTVPPTVTDTFDVFDE